MAVHAADKPVLKDQKQKISYGIGINIGKQWKQQSVEVDLDSFVKGVNDILAGGETLMTEQEVREVLTAYGTELRAKQEEKRKAEAEKNKKDGDAFLAENKKKEGVQVHPVKVGTNTYELQYKVITNGTGAIPTTSDTVTAHYRGTFIDGTEFDSSYKRGQPMERGVTGVIKGWTEALLQMKQGSKWQLFIPGELAYGERGGQAIPPNATLIFEVELIGIKPPAAPPTPPPQANQPVTSDIIKVPSAEELKKGAKIEVIKAQPGDK